MKHFIATSLFVMLIPISLLSQVAIDDALITTGENIQLKRGFGLSSGNVHKTSFGSFKTIDIQKGKKHFVGRDKEAFLEIKGKKAGIRKTVSSKNAQPFSLTIIQVGADTIISNINLITIKGGNHALIEISSGKSDNDEGSVSYCGDIQIQIKTDTLNWQMPLNPDQYTDYSDYSDFTSSFDRVLTNGVDNIMAKEADGFPIKRKLFKNSARGIVFIYNKKQVAALETYPETSIWFSKDIKPNHKQVIAAAMISFLSIRNSR